LQFNGNRLIFRRFRKRAINLDLPKIDRIYGYFEWFPIAKVKKLFSERVKPEILTYEPKELFYNLIKNIPNEKNDLNKLLYWEMRTFLVDHNLNYTDKLSMATGVEVRVPFLDMELLEFSTTIPPSLKMKGNTTKYILKKVMEKYLPHEVIYRSKVGFGAPVREWILNDLENKINQDLSEKAIRQQDIFNAQEIRELIEQNKSGKIDASYQIWGLLAIDSWLRQFIDKRY
jgi:asparagine synthase (glutamine-hydrolysing)